MYSVPCLDSSTVAKLSNAARITNKVTARCKEPRYFIILFLRGSKPLCTAKRTIPKSPKIIVIVSNGLINTGVIIPTE